MTERERKKRKKSENYYFRLCSKNDLVFRLKRKKEKRSDRNNVDIAHEQKEASGWKTR
jgi:hypothetical protein